MISEDLHPPSETYLIGVSGGHDSISLLETLLAQSYDHLIVCHLDHQLRGEESREDAEFVQRIAEERSLPCEIQAENVEALAGQHRLSLEAAGRFARHSFFTTCAKRHKTKRVMLAHHADDQAETILLHLLRGTGLAGLAGMTEVSPQADLIFHRPFLSYPRTFLPPPSAFREDSSNASLDHARNRLRKIALPALRDSLQRDPVPPLLRLSSLIRAENELLESMTHEALTGIRTAQGSLSTIGLRTLPLALQRRVLHHWLREDPQVSEVSFQVVEDIRHLLLHDQPSTVNLPNCLRVARRAKLLSIEPQ
ncbi:MAG: tRNA lysidine(34) synthetase TilS [Verrucomicrobiota bacterium]